jgi:hypothetical protein
MQSAYVNVDLMRMTVLAMSDEPEGRAPLSMLGLGGLVEEPRSLRRS